MLNKYLNIKLLQHCALFEKTSKLKQGISYRKREQIRFDITSSERKVP